MVHLRNHAVQKTIEGMRPLDAFDARYFLSAFFGEFLAFPDGQMLIGFPDKKDLALLGIDGVRHDYQHGFLLIDASQVEEIAVLSEGHRSVRVSRKNIVGVNNDHTVCFDESAKVLTVADEKLCWNRFVTHAGTSRDPPLGSNLDYWEITAMGGKRNARSEGLWNVGGTSINSGATEIIFCVNDAMDTPVNRLGLSAEISAVSDIGVERTRFSWISEQSL